MLSLYARSRCSSGSALRALVASLVVVAATGCKDKPQPSAAAGETVTAPEPVATPPSGPPPGAPALSEGNRAPTIDVENPQFCAGCHAAVVAEWGESMHAMADASKDPIYGAMRELRRKKQGDEVANKCLNCHSPRAVAHQRPTLAAYGVSCAGCHNVASVDASKGPGAKALVLAGPGEMLGPHDVKPGFSPVHGTGKAPTHMTDGSTLCLACHDALNTPSGAPACTTGPEWRSVAEAGGADASATCVSCHMPMVSAPSGSVTKRTQHRAHRFIGPHRAWLQDDPSLLRQAVRLSAVIKDEQIEVVVEATAGHAFPSGFPGRYAALVVQAKDAAGANVGTERVTMFNKVYVDAEGKRSPAAFAASLKEDTRLSPGEKRTVTFPLPAEVASAEVRLGYGLLPPPLAKKLGLGDSPLAQATNIQTITVAR